MRTNPRGQWLAVVLFAYAGALTAAQQSAPAAFGTITGEIVDQPSRRPVAGARVDLIPTSFSSAPNQPRQLSALTGADGRFEFRDVIAASYQLTASKGVLIGTYGKSRAGGSAVTVALAVGQRVDGLTILLLRRSSVAGRVLDERGRPMMGLPVHLMGIVEGMQGLTQAGVDYTAQTDDRGEFRASVDPGRYLAFVELNRMTRDPSAFAGMIKVDADFLILPRGLRDRDGVFTQYPVGPAVHDAPDGKRYTYVTTFAPGVRAAADARLISVGPAEDVAGVVIVMTPVRSFRVSGRVLGGNDPDAVVLLQLFGSEPTVAQPVGGMAATSESLVIMNAPEGDYRLVASRSFGRSDAIGQDPKGLWADMPALVHEGTTDGWLVTLRAGVEVSGTVHVDDTVGRPQTLYAHLDWAGTGLGDARYVSYAATVSGGTFRIPGVRPGDYVVRVDSRGAGTALTMRTASLGADDVADRPLRVGTEDIGDIVVTMTSRASLVSGVVRDDRSVPVAGAFVVAIPVDRSAWIDFGPGRFASMSRNGRRLVRTQTKMDGGYALSGLPAGDYYLSALSEIRVGDWPSREVLESVARAGTRLSIVDGESRAMDLRIGGR